MEVSAHQVKTMLDRGEDVVLLDCRNDNERAFNRIDPSLHIPMDQTPQRLGELPTDKPVIVYCHHGVRSRSVARFLQEQGMTDARSMTGGIDVWSLEIDSAVPRY